MNSREEKTKSIRRYIEIRLRENSKLGIFPELDVVSLIDSCVFLSYNKDEIQRVEFCRDNEDTNILFGSDISIEQAVRFINTNIKPTWLKDYETFYDAKTNSIF